LESNSERGLRHGGRSIDTTMTTATITVDRELVQSSFRDWQAEQAVLDAQLTESVAALEAYQAHLDGWQRALARERDELQRLREELDREKAVDGGRNEQNKQFEQELTEARAKISSLTTALLDRTEELRRLDQQRADASTELALVKAREKELSAAMESLQKSTDLQRTQWEAAAVEMQQQLEQSLEVAAAIEVPAPSEASAPPLGPTTTTNPVLGSLMEQFDKLRQQRSVGRQSQPRTR
jgi:chromosome segregation ATPase